MSKSTWRSRTQAFRDDLEKVVDVDWRHPAWQVVVRGSALFAPSSDGTEDAMQTYRSANGGPDSDTFMARPGATGGSVAERAARAVSAAFAAVEHLDELQPRLPGQNLKTCLQWEQGWLNPLVLAPDESRRVVLITPCGLFQADLDRTREEALGKLLCELLAGARPDLPHWTLPVDRERKLAVRAAVAVSLLDHGAPRGIHLHRSSWSRGGGPWLGLGEAENLHLVTTCHRAVEGFGHALLTERILNQVKAEAPALAALLASSCGQAGRIRFVAKEAPPTGSPQLGWARRVLTHGIGRFAHQSYAMGRALQIFFRGEPRGGADRPLFTPPFHVPVAPLDERGELQRDSLIRHGLLSVRLVNGGFESLADFERRLRDWIAAERRGEGLLTRLTVANCTSPLPKSLKRLLLRSRRRPSSWLPPIENLAGRGRISSMRFPSGERPAAPLYAVASPALFPTPRDPGGGQALTLIHHDQGCTVTLNGSGLSSTSSGAEAFLDLWLQQLALAISGEGSSRILRAAAGPAR